MYLIWGSKDSSEYPSIPFSKSHIKSIGIKPIKTEEKHIISVCIQSHTEITTRYSMYLTQVLQMNQDQLRFQVLRIQGNTVLA